jgi:hypothetical protein
MCRSARLACASLANVWVWDEFALSRLVKGRRFAYSLKLAWCYADQLHLICRPGGRAMLTGST